MEDAHIATINLGNAPDAAIFGVFDGHGGRLVLTQLHSTDGFYLQRRRNSTLHIVVRCHFLVLCHTYADACLPV